MDGEIKLKILLQEFLGDLKKQCVVLMGLPASGKSTFINNEIQSYIPGFKGYSISNSDSQVRSYQYQAARQHWDRLNNATKKLTNKVDISKEISKLKFGTRYLSNRGKDVELDIDYNWWVENKDKGFDNYWKYFFKTYYGSYFDIRDLAQNKDQQLFNYKIKESANLIVIDTTAANAPKVLSRLETAKEADFYNTIIYLEIDAELSIIRDKYREKKAGRGVGENIIISAANKMDSALKAYKTEAIKKGTVDRILHFKWTPTGDSPMDGKWVLKTDKRYTLKKNVKVKKG